MSEVKINTKVIELAIGDVKPYEGSHKTDETVVDMIKTSLQEFGFQQPIVIDKDNTVVAGNALLKAALALGIEKVPCLRADYLTEEQIQQYRIADNKTSEFAKWNEKKLRKELSYLESPQSLQYCFDTNILSMLGMDEKSKSSKPIVASKEDAALPSKKAEKKVLTEAQKDAKFKQDARELEKEMQAKPSEYWEYHCSKCGKLVKIKKS